MGIKSFFLKFFTWWNGQTFGTQLFTARKGEKVGEDDQGNVYYRTRDDVRRWVIFDGEVEASRIAPEWHGWLHRLYDTPPSEAPLPRKDWQHAHQPNLTGTPLAYAPSGSLRQSSPQARADYEAWSPE